MSLVIKVWHADLGRGLCGRVIGKDRVKMCVKPFNLNQCTRAHGKKAHFLPKVVSALGWYVLITVSVHMDQVWLTTSYVYT